MTKRGTGNMDSVLDFVRLSAAIGVGVLSADVVLGILVAAQARRKRAAALDKVKDFELELLDKLMPRMKDVMEVEDEVSDSEGLVEEGDGKDVPSKVINAGLGYL
jgi:hypothetical protein